MSGRRQNHPFRREKPGERLSDLYCLHRSNTFAGVIKKAEVMKNVKRAIALPLCMAIALSVAAQQTTEQRTQQPWTLQSCIAYALKENITLRRNRINVESAAVDVRTARAALFPSLSFTTSQNLVNRPYQESSSIVSGTEILSSSSKTSYNGNYGLNASWTLYNGNKRLKTLEQERLNNRTAELDVATAENSIEESITQVYLQILYAHESVKTNESTLALAEAQGKRGRKLLASGSIAGSDLAQLEAQVSTDRYQLVTAQATLEEYKLQLKQLLELDGAVDMNLALTTPEDESVLTLLPDKMDVYHSALAQRPEIEASKVGVQASILGIDIARAGYLPTLSLSAGIGTNNTSGNDFTFAEQMKNGWNNSLGLTLSVPIFRNRQTKSAVEKARLQVQTSQLDLLDQQKTLFKTIESLWLDANSAQQRYVAASEQLRSTQTSYDLINEQYGLGMKNTVELLTANTSLLSARQEQLQAKYMALLNARLLERYSRGEASAGQ